MNIRVDGKPLVVEAGCTLLQSLLQNGFDIPNLCYLPELEAYGGCGLCMVEIQGMHKPQRACTIMPWEGMEVFTASERLEESRRMNLGMLLSDHRGDCRPPCHLACPAGQDCQAYIGLLANGKFDEAFARIMEDNPLPGCIGRVCPHPCEDACRRTLLEGPLSLMQLKRFASEVAGSRFVPAIAAPSGKTVAVIGAGPAGLSAAYFLARKGHHVEVYDMMPQAGGMLRYGIPSYRLDKTIVDQEVARIESMGVRMHYGIKLGRDLSLEALQAQYDAVFVAVGAWQSAALGCPGDTLPGVLGGIDFLEQVACGNPPALGNRVAVVGGGNTAMDAVRTAIRLGVPEVHLIYRRTRAEMPADLLEIVEAEEEGVLFDFLVTPEQVLESDGRAVGLRLSQMRLGEADASGRRRPEPTGVVMDMPFDTIIAAIGQKVRPDGIDMLGKTRWNTIVADPTTYATNLEGVFAGGDAVNDGPGIAIAAIGHGKEAAQTIDGYLHGLLSPIVKPFYVRQEDIAMEDLPPTTAVPRAQVATESPGTRIRHFNEFTQTLSTSDAMREAQRCLECGCCDLYDCHLLPLLQQYNAADAHIEGKARKTPSDISHPAIWRDENKCILCGLCVRVCSDVVGVTALGFSGRGFDASARPAFDWTLKESSCISCGYCTQICPTGALQERRPYEKTPPLPITREASVCSHCPRGCTYELHQYGDYVIKAIPMDPQRNCSIGRYAPVIENERCGAFSQEQTAALRHMLTSDLRVFIGALPDAIGDIMLTD